MTAKSMVHREEELVWIHKRNILQLVNWVLKYRCAFDVGIEAKVLVL